MKARLPVCAALGLLAPLAAAAAERVTDGVSVTAEGETLPIRWFAPAEADRWRPRLEAVARKQGGPMPGQCGEAMAVARDGEAEAPLSYGAYCARMGDEALPVKICWDDGGTGYAVSTLIEKGAEAYRRRALAAFVAAQCWGGGG